VWGAVLIALGLLSLAGQLFRNMGFWQLIWPFFVIGAGALFFIGMFASGRSAAGLAIPGSIITMVGLILFAQNILGHWESWSYAWTLILLSVGLGIFIMGWYSEDASQRKSGVGLMKLGAILFLLFGGFFEMIFNSFVFSKYLFPLVLILVGAYLLIARSGALARRSEAPEQPQQVPPAS
jgi:hypothetical protein